MGSRIRLIESHRAYNITERCVDRQFLFKPNHDPRHPLLAKGCPPKSLRLDNDIIPEPSTINIIGSSLARALEQRPIPLYWAEYQLNHAHKGAGTNPAEPDNLAEFQQIANSLIARQLNKQWKREGHLFTGPYRLEPILDDASMEQKLIYSLTNSVKDGMVEKVSQTPFFSTYRQQAQGKKLAYWYIDFAAYWAAGGPTKNGRLKDFLKWINLELTPLPAWQDLTVFQRQTKVRHLVRAEQEAIAKKRKNEKRTVVGVPNIMARDPRARPENPKESGPQPLCHAADKKLRDDFKKTWREIKQAHLEASWDYRMGAYERPFPNGTYRPPIKTIYDSSKL